MIKLLENGKTPIPFCKVTVPAGAPGGLVHRRSTGFYGLIILPDGTNNVTVNVFDSMAASGTRILPQNIVISGTGGLWTFSIDPPIFCDIGLYVQISVAGGGSCQWQACYIDE